MKIASLLIASADNERTKEKKCLIDQINERKNIQRKEVMLINRFE